MRGAWIEIPFAFGGVTLCRVSLPVRGAWIEIVTSPAHARASGSLPVRGAWIEMSGTISAMNGCWVAPRAGSVD